MLRSGRRTWRKNVTGFLHFPRGAATKRTFLTPSAQDLSTVLSPPASYSLTVRSMEALAPSYLATILTVPAFAGMKTPGSVILPISASAIS